MKILHVVPGLNEGGNGIAVAAKLLAREQSKSGAEVEVVDTRDFVHSNIRTIRTIEQYSEVWVHSMWLPMTLKACWKVLRNVRMFECSECSNARPKLVRMTHANLDPLRYRYHGWKKRLVASIERWLFRRTDRVVVTCEAEKKWCQEWGLKNRFEIVDLKRFFDLKEKGEGRKEKDGGLHLLYLGRRHPLKGVEFLEQAVQEVNDEVRVMNDERRKVEFLIVNGEAAPSRTSKAYAYRVNEIEVVPGTLGGKIAPTTYPTDTTSICGSILLQGVVDVNGRLGESKSEHSNNRTIDLRIVSDHFGEELERDWAWCDVLCLPTLSENFGLVVAEALERGKRVVTTDGAPAWEPPEAAEVKVRGEGEQWRDRIIYLRGFRDGTDEERVELLKEALEKVSG